MALKASNVMDNPVANTLTGWGEFLIMVRRIDDLVLGSYASQKTPA
jgi:hypothetical protein